LEPGKNSLLLAGGSNRLRDPIPFARRPYRQNSAFRRTGRKTSGDRRGPRVRQSTGYGSISNPTLRSSPSLAALRRHEGLGKPNTTSHSTRAEPRVKLKVIGSGSSSRSLSLKKNQVAGSISEARHQRHVVAEQRLSIDLGRWVSSLGAGCLHRPPQAAPHAAECPCRSAARTAVQWPASWIEPDQTVLTRTPSCSPPEADHRQPERVLGAVAEHQRQRGTAPSGMPDLP